MTDDKLANLIVEELKRYSPVLENHFHNMLDIEFVVENNDFYLITARKGKRTSLANLKIVMSMFCEGIMSVDDVVLNLPYKQIEDLLDTDILTNEDELEKLATGLPASKGVGTGRVCFSYDEAIILIDERQNFIYCRYEVSPEDVDIMSSYFCQGVMTARGGMTSHAAVVCRGIGITCVSGFGDYEKIKCTLKAYDNLVTIDGNNGSIYGGIGSIEKSPIAVTEINLLYQLLKIIIKCNAVSPTTSSLVWRLWDVVVLDRRYGGINNTKRLVDKKSTEYISFCQPSQDELDKIYSNLYSCENMVILVEDFIGFLISQLSAQVSLGSHYTYMRPLLNPMDNMEFTKADNKCRHDSAGCQLTGVEFFNINHLVDYLIDIESIKIYFNTEFFNYDDDTEASKEYLPLNYLDFTNPKGESLIINTYNAKSISVYINDALIPSENLAMVYHLIRRRTYHWSWHKENNVTKKEIIHYLSSKAYFKNTHSKMYYLCKEMNLIEGINLTSTGESLLGRDYFE